MKNLIDLKYYKYNNMFYKIMNELINTIKSGNIIK